MKFHKSSKNIYFIILLFSHLIYILFLKYKIKRKKKKKNKECKYRKNKKILSCHPT